MQEIYLGDAVYVKDTDGTIVLRIDDGFNDDFVVYLKDTVMLALIDYWRKHRPNADIVIQDRYDICDW